MVRDSEKILNARIDLSDLVGYVQEFPNVLHKALERVAFAIQGEVQREAPIDTGKLRGSVQSPQSVGVLSFLIPINAEYWPAVQFGTGVYGPNKKPITIRPKSAKVLRFEIEGRVVFAKYAIVRGQKPNPFVDRGIDNVTPNIPDIIGAFLEDAI